MQPDLRTAFVIALVGLVGSGGLFPIPRGKLSDGVCRTRVSDSFHVGGWENPPEPTKPTRHNGAGLIASRLSRVGSHHG